IGAREGRGTGRLHRRPYSGRPICPRRACYRRRGHRGGHHNVVPGVTRATLASGERTTLVKFEMEAGATIPEHSHPHEQTGFLVSGNLMLFGEDGEWPVTVGDSWSIPGAMAHGAHTEAGATIVEVFTPVRTEYLPGPPGRPPSR